MEDIKTFVFFDLETTGLPHSSPRITEISFVAAGRDQILEKHDGVAKENSLRDGFLPRVLNKLNITVYPCKIIHPGASLVSGLTNENLEHQMPFDDNIFNILQLFMERLNKPICLVAHNGDKFDFPILRSELNKLGKEFSEDLLCVDSLPGLREVLTSETKSEAKGDANDENEVIEGIKPLGVATNRALDLVPKCGFSQEDDDQEMIRTLEVSERIVQEYENNFNADEIQRRIKSEMEKMRRANETTPVRKSKQVQSTGDHVRRRILNEPGKQRPKFTLGAVYERVTKKELVNAHRAENDAQALLECVAAIGRPIIEWMDANRKPFRSIKRLW